MSWAARPLTDEFGDWTWAYRLRSWLGTYVLKSSDGGATWIEAAEGTTGAYALTCAFPTTDPVTVFAGTYQNGVILFYAAISALSVALR